MILSAILDEIQREVSKGREEDQDDRSAALIRSDLTFLIPLLRKYPKCYWIWNYRLWLLEQAADRTPAEGSLLIWEEDLALVSKMLSLDSRNFLAWGYRRTVVAGLERINSLTSNSLNPLTESEFEYTTKMINVNLSNFSAWHRRSKLIPQLLSQRKANDSARRQMLDSELELVQRALYAGDNDQSIWFYHQVLMCNFDPRYSKDAIAPALSSEERIKYLWKEIAKILEMLDGAEDCKWIYQALISMSILHQESNGQWPRRPSEAQEWLDNLQRLDPLRAGRWRDLKRQLSSVPESVQ